jgi:hypothetical protein
MQLLLIVLSLALVAVVVALIMERGKASKLNKLLEASAPFLFKAGFPFGLPLQGWPFQRWQLVASGGNTNAGVTGGLGNCPCQKEYTVKTIQVVFPARPNAAQIAAATFNKPAPDKPAFPCKDNCVNVMTHIWHGWLLFQDTVTGQCLLNNETFAQFHCKKPNDPDVEKPPKENDPGGDIQG